MHEKRIFEVLKEDRDWYFVEYRTPIGRSPFATLSLVVPEIVDTKKIADAMEHELEIWLNRYPIPLMITAFDGKDNVCKLESVRPCDHLIGFVDKLSQEPRLLWRLLSSEELPVDAHDIERLYKTYSDIPYRTITDRAQEISRRHKELRRGITIIFLWTSVLPALWLIVEWASPQWVTLPVVLYSLWRIYIKARQMRGTMKKSPHELEEDEKERKMRHYFYHCERNPAGFLRLKTENFEKEMLERTREEARLLKEK